MQRIFSGSNENTEDIPLLRKRLELLTSYNLGIDSMVLQDAIDRLNTAEQLAQAGKDAQKELRAVSKSLDPYIQKYQQQLDYAEKLAQEKNALRGESEEDAGEYPEDLDLEPEPSPEEEISEEEKLKDQKEVPEEEQEKEKEAKEGGEEGQTEETPVIQPQGEQEAAEQKPQSARRAMTPRQVNIPDSQSIAQMEGGEKKKKGPKSLLGKADKLDAMQARFTSIPDHAKRLWAARKGGLRGLTKEFGKVGANRWTPLGTWGRRWNRLKSTGKAGKWTAQKVGKGTKKAADSGYKAAKSTAKFVRPVVKGIGKKSLGLLANPLFWKIVLIIVVILVIVAVIMVIGGFIVALLMGVCTGTGDALFDTGIAIAGFFIDIFGDNICDEVGVYTDESLVEKYQKHEAPDSSGYTFDSTDIQAQMVDASPELQALLDCMKDKLPAKAKIISSISETIPGVSGTGMEKCTTNYVYGKDACEHTRYSCHYGGRNCQGKSYAVDFGNEYFYRQIGDVAYGICNANSVLLEGRLGEPGAHVHVSIENERCGCDENIGYKQQEE